MSNISLPYVTAPGNIEKAMLGIKAAAVPEKVSQDFVKTILKVPGGSGNQILSFIKKLGMVNPDGSPNELYKKLRNPSSSGNAMAEAIKHAYAQLYKHNEYAHQLPDDDLVGLIVEVTGQAHDSNSVKLTANCFKQLKSFANFESQSTQNSNDAHPESPTQNINTIKRQEHSTEKTGIGLNLGYTINLNLPPSTDPRVFDAIFRSLKDNLLRDDDA